MRIRSLESYLENHIEGFFNQKFSSDLQPEEIKKYITKELEQRVERNHIPNSYAVHMAEEDWQRLHTPATYEQIYTHIVSLAIRQSFQIDDKLKIELCAATDLKKGTVRVTSAFVKSSLTSSLCGDEALERTQVFEKTAVGQGMDTYERCAVATLCVLSGPDAKVQFVLSAKRAHLGRRPSNECLLSDPSTSRLHSYVVFENYRHVLYDAESLNGTYVNSELIGRHILCCGDKIKIGNTVLVYEVK